VSVIATSSCTSSKHKAVSHPTVGRRSIDIREVTLDSLRANVGVVFQESMLFYRSIADNLRVGRPEATEAELLAAARLAEAHDFILRQPEGYNTQIGERGATLSGGERQRLAIARALLKDPPVLILDEATSALDSESEYLIQDALRQLMRSRTSVVIAHRLSTILHADRIVVMDQGRIVQVGPHAQLLAEGGLYGRLYERQFRAGPAPGQLSLVKPYSDQAAAAG
jgi:ATP-binding cassette subfamily B protein